VEIPPKPKRPPQGQFDEIADFEWNEIESSIKTKHYRVPGRLSAQMRARAYKEEDVDCLIDSGYLHEITSHNAKKGYWKVRWFGYDSKRHARFCVFAYFETKGRTLQWELVAVSPVLER